MYAITTAGKMVELTGTWDDMPYWLWVDHRWKKRNHKLYEQANNEREQSNSFLGYLAFMKQDQERRKLLHDAMRSHKLSMLFEGPMPTNIFTRQAGQKLLTVQRIDDSHAFVLIDDIEADTRDWAIHRSEHLAGADTIVATNGAPLTYDLAPDDKQALAEYLAVVPAPPTE